MSLILTLDTLTVTFPAFMELKLPRTRTEKVASTRSAMGAFNAYGAAYELPFIWEFQGLITQADWQLLEMMWAEHDDRRRRSAGQQIVNPDDDPTMLLVDTFQLVRERLPRTRAIAPTTIATTIATNYVEYFAQFNVWFGRVPELLETVYTSEFGYCVIAQMLLEETDAKTPP